MSSAKTKCSRCGTDILVVTADLTGGLCMPCKNGTLKRPDPKTPVMVSCGIRSTFAAETVIHVAAQDLLAALEQTRHFGDSLHPNMFELDAQRALLKHAIRHRTEFRLHDDHWGRTGWVLLDLFEKGAASMEVAGVKYRFADVSKTDWREGNDPLGMEGGYSYVAHDGSIIFKTMTWIS